jgi:hypothetical protein
MHQTLWTVGLALLCGSVAMGEQTVTATTNDRGDGKPGHGADLWLLENSPDQSNHRGKMAKLMLVRCMPERTNSIGVVRFDLSRMQDKGTIKSVELKLNYGAQNTNTMKVWGLLECGDAEHFKERGVAWNTFPGLKKADGDYSTTEWEQEKVVELGSFKNPEEPGWITFSSDALTKLVKDDQNATVVLMIQAPVKSNSSSYATKEGNADRAAQLAVTFE